MKKRGFVLLEVMIAISIAGIALVWMMKSTSSSMKKQLESINKIECERMIELAFFDALLALKKHPDKDLEIFDGQGHFQRTITSSCSDGKKDNKGIFWKQVTVSASFPKLKRSDTFLLVYKKT